MSEQGVARRERISIYRCQNFVGLLIGLTVVAGFFTGCSDLPHQQPLREEPAAWPSAAEKQQVIAWLKEAPYTVLLSYRARGCRHDPEVRGKEDLEVWRARGRAIGGVVEALTMLLQEGESTDDVDLVEVTIALEELGGRKAVEALAAALSDQRLDSMVRLSAAMSLGNIGDSVAVEALSSSAVRDPNHNVRANAYLSLAKIRGQGARPYLESAVEADKDQFVTRVAKDALARLDLARLERSHAYLATTVDLTFEQVSLLQAVQMLEDELGERIPWQLEGTGFRVIDRLVTAERHSPPMSAGEVLILLATKSGATLRVRDATIVFVAE